MDVTCDNIEENCQEKKEKDLVCSFCNKGFTFKTNLYRHMKNAHKKMETCIMPGCRAKFRSKTELLSHIEKEHGENTCLTFTSLEEFYAWKLREEVQNFVCFTKRCGDQSVSSVIIQHYICHLSRKVAAKETLSKMDLFCPARMVVKLCKASGQVTVIYFKTHSHMLTYSTRRSLPIPECLRHEIKQKLKKGMSVDQILQELQNRHKSQLGISVAMYNRLQCINESQIRVIKKHMIKRGKLSQEMVEAEDEVAVQEIVETSMEPIQPPDSDEAGDYFAQQLLFSTQPESHEYSSTEKPDSTNLQGMFKEILALMENETVCRMMMPSVLENTKQMLTLCKASSSGAIQQVVEEIVVEDVNAAAHTLTML